MKNKTETTCCGSLLAICAEWWSRIEEKLPATDL